MIARERIVLVPAAAVLIGATSFAMAVSSAPVDTIHRTNGTAINDVTISNETLSVVSYTQDRQDRTIASDEVLRVEFERMPKDVDEAMGFLGEGDLLAAMQYLDSYVDGEIAKPSERRYKWAPAYAAWRSLELRMQTADLKGARAAAKRLIENFPDSRYVPAAFLLQANAEKWMGSGSTARETLDQFAQVIQTRSLSTRWDLECRLAKIRTDSSKTGAAQRAELDKIGREAGSSFPTVRGRAKVAEGESYLGEAERTTDTKEANSLRAKAKDIFDEIIDDTSADSETLAGAYTGLGDCLFFAGAAAADNDKLRDAAKTYLRVVVNHEEQSQYVPKALYYAFRCFTLMGDKVRRSDMRRELLNLYRDSEWAKKSDLK